MEIEEILSYTKTILAYAEVVFSSLYQWLVKLYHFLEQVLPDPIYAQLIFALPVLYFFLKILFFFRSFTRKRKTLKGPIGNRVDMGNGLVVRSFSESYIVEYLIKKDIPFEYERRIVLNNVVIYPDFTLYPESDTPLYLEHFGVKNIKAYDKKTKIKKKLYKKYCRRRFIYTDVNDKRKLLRQLKKQLRKVRAI